MNKDIIKENFLKGVQYLKIYYLLLAFIILMGCNKTITAPFPETMDIPDKGFYSGFYINEDVRVENLPDFLKTKPPHKMSTLNLFHPKEFVYADQLKIDSTPYFIFIDSEKNVFQTGDLHKAKQFFEENILN